MAEYEQRKLPLETPLDTLLEQYAQAESQYKVLQNAMKSSEFNTPPNNYGSTRSQAALIEKPLYISEEEAASLEGQVEILTNRTEKPTARATDLAQRIESINHQDSRLARKQVMRINNAFHGYLESGKFDEIENNYKEQANALVQEAPKYLNTITGEEKRILRETLVKIPQQVLSEESREQYEMLQEQLYDLPNPEVAKENIRKLKELLEND